MNKKNIGLMLATLILLTIAPPIALGQTNNSVSDIKQNLKEKRIQFQKKVELTKERHNKRRIKLTEQVQKRVQHHLEKIFKRLNSIIIRFDNITSRVQSRINILKDKGVDTSEAEEKLEEVKFEIEQLKTNVDIASSEIYSMIENKVDKEVKVLDFVRYKVGEGV